MAPVIGKNEDRDDLEYTHSGLEDLRQQCLELRHEYVRQSTGSDWMKHSPMLKFLNESTGLKDLEDDDFLKD